jgi:nucleotide-binding universal stress UspA family protein
MYKHILVPTDGSELSAKAVKAAIKLASALGARLTAFYAMTPYPLHGGYAAEASVIDDLQPKIYDQRNIEHAQKILLQITRSAEKAGLSCAAAYTESAAPSDAIIDAAKQGKCDLIVMASHGRRGLAGVLLGSETQRVLTHSSIPVLVYR